MNFSQRGIITPLLAAVLLGLLAVTYTLIFDNYIVAIQTTKLRSHIEALCEEVASEAPLQRDALISFNSKITQLDSELPDWIEILSGTLTMGTMPETYSAANTSINRSRVASCDTNLGQAVGNADIALLSLDPRIHYEWNLCASDFAAKWGTLNISKDYHAGTFVGCEVKARIRTYFSPRTVPAGITIREGSDAQPRTRLVYSRFGYWKFPWTADNPTTKPQGLVVAIAPQIPFQPTLTESTGVLNKFNEILLDRNNYLNPVSLANQFDRLRRKTGVPNAGQQDAFIAAPFFDSTILSRLQQRTALYQLFAGAPIVIRQRLSSAIIELASRDGMLRSNTAVLLSNPRSEDIIPANQNYHPEIIPPIILRDLGEDLRSENISTTPLLFSQYNHSGLRYSDPFYHFNATGDPNIEQTGNAIPLNPSDNPSVNEQEVSSLISRFPTLGLHLDSSTSWHQTRLFSGGGDFPFSSLKNFIDDTHFFEPLSYSWGNYGGKATSEFTYPSNDYFDRLNNFKRITSGEITNYRPLSVSQLIRSIGASVKCPYQLKHAGGTEYCSGFLGFQPDVEGVIKAWLGEGGGATSRVSTQLLPNNTGATGTRYNAVKLPGIYSTSYVQWEPQVTRASQLALFLNAPLYNTSGGATASEQLVTIRNKITSLIDGTTKLPTGTYRPITVIYIPTRNEDSTSDVLDQLTDTFQANICAPTIRSDIKRGNVLIPFIYNSDQFPYATDPNYSCIQQSFPCTKENSLQAVWDCMLNGNTTESIAKQIFNETIMLKTRIF